MINLPLTKKWHTPFEIERHKTRFFEKFAERYEQIQNPDFMAKRAKIVKKARDHFLIRNSQFRTSAIIGVKDGHVASVSFAGFLSYQRVSGVPYPVSLNSNEL